MRVDVERASTHAILHAAATPAEMRRWLREYRPKIRVMSSGTSLEIYKEIGLPEDVLTRFGVPPLAETR